jgi:hypothetical protein
MPTLKAQKLVDEKWKEFQKAFYDAYPDSNPSELIASILCSILSKIDQRISDEQGVPYMLNGVISTISREYALEIEETYLIAKEIIR